MRGAGNRSARQLREEIGDSRGPTGRPLCTWCRTEVPKGRRKWCRPECLEAYLNTRWQRLRELVHKRDKGVCALCKADTAAMQREFRRWRPKGRRAHGIIGQAAKDWLKGQGIPITRIDSDWWDADHIVPCAEGGADTLDNLRTLCLRCHRGETNALAKRLQQKKGLSSN